MGLKKFGYVAKSLVQPPGQTERPTTIKISMHLPERVPYGHFFENLEIRIFSHKNGVFAHSDLEKLLLPNKKFGGHAMSGRCHPCYCTPTKRVVIAVDPDIGELGKKGVVIRVFSSFSAIFDF